MIKAAIAGTQAPSAAQQEVTPQEGRRSTARLDSLQMLRALAAMAVVLFHCRWTGIASFGVELFFVISGFIICHAASLDSRQFLFKRLLRVVPLYWLATAGIYALALLLPSVVPASHPNTGNLIRSLAFIPYQREDGNAFPLLFLGWTLNYEMFFYVVFAVSLRASRRLAPILAVAILVISSGLHRWLAPVGLAFEFWSQPIVLNFVCGILAWITWKQFPAALARLSTPMATSIALFTLFLLALGVHQHLGGSMPWAGLLGAMLVLAMLRLDASVFWPPIFLLIGDASYSLYLLHPYVLVAFDRFVHPFGPNILGVVVSIVAICASVAIAIMGYRAVERPSNRYLRRVMG